MISVSDNATATVVSIDTTRNDLAIFRKATDAFKAEVAEMRERKSNAVAESLKVIAACPRLSNCQIGRGKH